MAEPIDYGQKIQYDPLWKGPMDKPRTPTDTKFLKILGVFCLCWIGIAIYAYSYGQMTLPKSKADLGITSNSTDDPVIQKTISKISSVAFRFIALAAILSIVYIILLRWYTKLIVYTVIFLAFLVLFALICITTAAYAEDKRKTEALSGSIVCVIMFIALLIFIIVLRHKINIACEVIKESSKAVIFFPSTLLFPLLPYFLYIIVVMFAGSVLLFLSLGPEHEETPVHIYFFHLINLFGFLWVGSFVAAFSRMVLSGTFATWYWTQNKKYVPHFTLMNFMEKTVKNHLGTLAFGSLILAICQLVRMLLKSIKKKLKGSGNPLICCCFGWYQHLFGTLESILKCITNNAYIMCAIHGTDFIQSAKDSFNLLMRSIVKFLVINNVTIGILAVGQLLAMSLSTWGAYKYCGSEFKENDITAVVVSVLIGSLLITECFFMVLRTAIDTIFLSVLEDYERNDGSDEKPYYMSFKLKTLLLE